MLTVTMMALGVRTRQREIMFGVVYDCWVDEILYQTLLDD